VIYAKDSSQTPVCDNPPRLTGKPKIKSFETVLSGLMLEVRQTGLATYNIRYRDKGG
jgi:hypothetical protein